MKWKIIQTSPPRTASTVLSNLLHGFICPEEPLDYGLGASATNKDIVVTHDDNIDRWESKLGDEYVLYFVVSERPQRGSVIESRYYNYDRVLRFNFNELNAVDGYCVRDVVDVVHGKLEQFLPKEIMLNKLTALGRLENMNKFYEEIKDRPFTYHDLFYHLHGTHRTR